LSNAKKLADEMMNHGFKLVTNGTDNHLIMADVYGSFGVDGRVVQDLLDKIRLSANCNSIPDDPLPPFKPSGLRLGTPAMTTRGLKEEHMAQIAEWLAAAIKNRNDEKTLNKLSNEVREFSLQFPLPSDK
jgi:glycine hydroxymethyltransferase